MEKFKDIRVRYSHPAIPPMGIQIDKTYTIGYLMDNYNLDELIKIMFIPLDTTWEELTKKDVKKSKNIKVVSEEREE